MGFAILERGEDRPRYIGSGIWGVKRGEKEEYQKYKLRLIEFWTDHTPELFDRYMPDEVVSEIVPVVGGGNFVAATQSQLAGTAITTVHAMAYYHGKPVAQIGATTIKKRIGGTNKATKVRVRNGVYRLIPELKERAGQWTKVFDEPDAIATGLVKLGYQNE